MLELFLFTLVSIFTTKKVIEVEKLPDDFITEKDSPAHDLKPCNIGLINPVGKKPLICSITGSELMKQIEIYFPFGQKDLDYLFSHQEMIPEIFKSKTILFMGTIYQNKYGRFFTPCLSYHDIRKIWIKSFFCLSDPVSLKHNRVPIFLGNISN